jgi:hypothetical protein
MKIESHLENLEESIREIKNAVKEGLEKKQRTIGFHTSSAAIDMLEIILHKNNLIDPGFIIKHEWINSKNKIEEKLSFKFLKKEEILQHIIKIESARNKFCYGKRQKEDVLEKIVDEFNKLKDLFAEVSGYEL